MPHKHLSILALIALLALAAAIAALYKKTDSANEAEAAKLDLFCLRLEVQDVNSPIKSYKTVSANGAVELHESEMEGKFALVRWTKGARGLSIDRGNIGLFFSGKQLDLLKQCSLNVQIRAEPSVAVVEVVQPVTERWFRVSLDEPSSTTDGLSSWGYSIYEARAKHFDVSPRVKGKDWENFIFPEGASVRLMYPSLGISISKNLVHSYTVKIDVTTQSSTCQPVAPSK